MVMEPMQGKLRKDPVLRHGPEGPAGSLARKRLLLGHLDDVEGEGAAGGQVRQVPPPHVVLVSLLVGCRGERVRAKGRGVSRGCGRHRSAAARTALD